jgi:hypothetical protein
MCLHGSIKTIRIYLRKDTDVEKLWAQMEARDAYVGALREKARGAMSFQIEGGWQGQGEEGQSQNLIDHRSTNSLAGLLVVEFRSGVTHTTKVTHFVTHCPAG